MPQVAEDNSTGMPATELKRWLPARTAGSPSRCARYKKVTPSTRRVLGRTCGVVVSSRRTNMSHWIEGSWNYRRRFGRTSLVYQSVLSGIRARWRTWRLGRPRNWCRSSASRRSSSVSWTICRAFGATWSCVILWFSAN